MIEKPEPSRFSKRGELFFKLILLALVLVWVVFPPRLATQSGMNDARIETAASQSG